MELDSVICGQCELTMAASQVGAHICMAASVVQPKPRQRYVGNKQATGRPKGFDGTRSRMPSALAQAFKKQGLDWKIDFAEAIKNNKKERIKLWLRLLPYMITTSRRAKVKKWKGRASKAALIALDAMEQDV